MNDRFRGRLEYVRRILAGMYDEMDEVPEGTVGKHATKFAISDAIDNLDKALGSCPSSVAAQQTGEPR